MKMIKKFQKFWPLGFHGGSDPLATYRLKEDIGNILDLMGMNPTQRLRLVAFSLKVCQQVV